MSQDKLSSNKGGIVGSFLRFLFAHEGVSGTLWNLVFSLTWTGYALMALAPVLVWLRGDLVVPLVVGIMGSGFTVAGKAWKHAYATDIPSNPPHVGVLTIVGERHPIIEGEGDAMAGPGIEYTLVNMLACDYDFTFEAPCRASSNTTEGATSKKKVGSSVRVKVSMTSFPDYNKDDPDLSPDRIIKYLDHDGREGVRTILEGMLGQGIRHEAGRHTAEEFTLMQDALSVALLVNIADVEFREVDIGEDGRITNDNWEGESLDDVSPQKYKDLPQIPDPLRYLFPDDEGDETAKLRREQSVKIFLKVAERNGVSDIKNLGIRITRLNVESIELEAAIREAAAKAEAELKERDAEKRDTDTDIELARKYVAASDGKLEFERALETVRINRGRSKEFIVRSSGNPFLDAAAALQSGKP